VGAQQTKEVSLMRYSNPRQRSLSTFFRRELDEKRVGVLDVPELRDKLDLDIRFGMGVNDLADSLNIKSVLKDETGRAFIEERDDRSLIPKPVQCRLFYPHGQITLRTFMNELSSAHWVVAGTRMLLHVGGIVTPQRVDDKPIVALGSRFSKHENSVKTLPLLRCRNRVWELDTQFIVYAHQLPNYLYLAWEKTDSPQR
jgi:hypothetical protein